MGFAAFAIELAIREGERMIHAEPYTQRQVAPTISHQGLIRTFLNTIIAYKAHQSPLPCLATAIQSRERPAINHKISTLIICRRRYEIYLQ